MAADEELRGSPTGQLQRPLGFGPLGCEQVLLRGLGPAARVRQGVGQARAEFAALRPARRSQRKGSLVQSRGIVERQGLGSLRGGCHVMHTGLLFLSGRGEVAGQFRRVRPTRAGQRVCQAPMTIHNGFRRQAPDDRFADPIVIGLDLVFQPFASGAEQTGGAEQGQGFVTFARDPRRLAGVELAERVARHRHDVQQASRRLGQFLGAQPEHLVQTDRRRRLAAVRGCLRAAAPGPR